MWLDWRASMDVEADFLKWRLGGLERFEECVSGA